MDIWYYIMTPFTWLLMAFYQFFNSYGVALIFFTLIVKILLFPLALKGKKSMIQTNMLTGQMQKLQKMYGNNQAKYNEEVQKLYEKEGVSPTSGCLWGMAPLFILLPLFAIIRQPLKYMMGMTYEQIVNVGNTVLNWSTVALENGWIKEAGELTEKILKMGYNQLYLSSLITPDNLGAVQAAAGTTAKEIFCLNFSFLGINLSDVPTLKFWTNGLSWASIGLFLVPLLSVALSCLMSMVSMKTNAINNPNGAQNKSTNVVMMLTMSVMYLFFGFSMPAAISVYFMANSVLGIGQEFICAKILKKDYEKAAAAQKQRELEEKEEEKRLRREKAEERARLAEEARKNKGKKKSKDDEDRIPPEVREASRVGIRQYARGRAYDPKRFGEVTPYEEDVIDAFLTFPTKEDRKKKKEKAAQEKAAETKAEEMPAAPAPEEPEEVSAPEEETPAQEEDLVEKLQAEIDETLGLNDEQETRED